MILPASEVRLGSVRLHAHARDPLRARQALDRALASVDWEVPGHPPGSVLVVRRLSATAPGGTIRPGQPDFARGISRTLRELAGAARRPWLQPDAVGADAVLFADEAELAACLARDWLQGRVAERWWWRGILGRQSAGEWLRDNVLARGEAFVPALALLAERGGAASFAARLAEHEAETALIALARTHRLDLSPTPPPHPPPAPAPRAPVRRTRAPAAVPALEPLAGETREQAQAAARLLQAVPELRGVSLTRAQARLLAAALALVRAPAWARSPHLAVALASVERAPVSAPIPSPEATTLRPTAMEPESASAPPAAPSRPPQRAPTSSERGTQLPSSDAPPAREGRRIAPVPPAPSAAHGRTYARAPALEDSPLEPPATVQAAPAQPSSPASVRDAPSSPRATPPPTPAPLLPAPTAAPEPELARALRERVQTRFGGIFYLLNAALALELYGDFSAPRAPGLDLLPWDWLALVGDGWFGEEFAADPLAELLARLAGREPREPRGADFIAPREWRVPAGWLPPWGPASHVRIAATRDRLRVLHPAGFLLCDVARDRAVRPLAQARAICARYPELEGADIRREASPSRRRPSRAPTARWLGWLLDFLAARLALALGLEDAAAVPAYVCRHDATVSVTPSTVVVRLTLADLPLPIRIAGLDRDAGWIPAAGRSLSFEFA